MMILLESICWVFLIFLFLAPKLFYIPFFGFNGFSKKELKEFEIRYYGCELPKNELIDTKNGVKICTQYQPFRIDDKKYVVCNFICDGDCQFKGMKYYIEK